MRFIGAKITRFINEDAQFLHSLTSCRRKGGVTPRRGRTRAFRLALNFLCINYRGKAQICQRQFICIYMYFNVCILHDFTYKFTLLHLLYRFHLYQNLIYSRSFEQFYWTAQDFDFNLCIKPDKSGFCSFIDMSLVG